MTMSSPSKKRILFVDDEAMVLQGLQRMLRPMREEWEMEFADSGAKALEMMTAHPFDVVVSDMRMPAMNGTELLSQVMVRFPKTVRLILSGHADRDLIMKCVGSTHQYLSKPCDPEALKAIIARTISLEGTLQNERVRAIVSRIDRLPSLPTLYIELTRLLADHDVSMEQVGTVISKDIAMTGKILKLVNSAFFGLRHEVTSPTEAASYLGVDLIKSLVLVLNVFSQFEFKALGGFSLDSLWQHSLKIGHAAKLLATLEHADETVARVSFTSGVLHDAGKLVLIANWPREYAAVLERMPGCCDIEAEREVFGTTHAEVGGYLFGLWGLPVPVVEAITLHHEPGQSADSTFSALTAVHAACALLPDETSGRAPMLDERYLQSVGLLERVPTWAAELQSQQTKRHQLAA